VPTLPLVSRDVVFGNLPSSDVSTAVVRRIRAAIGLGLLAGGEKLPKEAELAKRFGISSFTLREALSILRAEGLIETRAGKYGGSFVRRSPKTAALARDELCRLSFSELRDLGDWRQMLTAQAAGLAARRASQSNVERLASYADQVSESETPEQARRAHGRFHLELAAAGQSMRLNQAEFAMHDQLDWLFGLVLDDEEKRLARAAVRAHSEFWALTA
jgi:DNA-binding FadR family transcriptional regulator